MAFNFKQVTIRRGVTRSCDITNEVNSEIYYLCYSLSLISCLLCKGLMIRIQQ